VAQISFAIRAVECDGDSNAAIPDKIGSVATSVDPATNSDPWRDNNRTNNGTCDDHSTACADTARPVHTASADDGVGFGCRQGNEAAY
jgi:hypothetical protein